MESFTACWMSFSLSSSVMDVILGILCGIAIFLLLLPFLPSEPNIPQCRKHRNVGKLQKEPKERNRKANKTEALNVDLKKLERTWNQTAHPQSMEWMCQAKGSRCPIPVEHKPCEECKAQSAGTQSLSRQHVPAQSPVTPTAPPTDHTLRHLCIFPTGPKTEVVSRKSDLSKRKFQPPSVLPLGCTSHQLTFSPPKVHLPDSGTSPPTLLASPASQWERPTQSHWHSSALPLATVPQSSSLYPRRPASQARIISGITQSICPVSTFSSCKETAQTLSLCLSIPSPPESQHEDISSPSSGGLCCAGPTNREKDCESLSLLKPENIGSRSEQDINTIGENVTNLAPTIPNNHIHSLGMKTQAASSSWSITGRSEQIPSSQPLPDPKDSGNNVYHECVSQFFWGLPSLHSESLVGTAWLSKKSSGLHSSSLLFNGMLSTSPGKMHPNISPTFSQAKPGSPRRGHPQHLSGHLSECQPPPLVEIKAKPSLQNIPPLSLLQKTDCESAVSSAEHKEKFHTQFGHPQPKWPLFQESESGWSLSPAAERSQQIFSVCSSSSPEDNLVASILPGYFPVSSELRQQLEKHLQKWIIQHQWEVSHRIQDSLELKPQQGTRDWTGQVEGKAGNSKASALTGENSNSAQHSKDLAQGPGSKDSGSSPEKTLVAKCEDSDSDSGLSSSESETDISRTLNANIERTLRNHLVRKFGKIYEGLIPVGVARSCLAVSDAGWIPGSHLKRKNARIFTQCENCRNTSERAEFLDSLTRSLLEEHIIRSWVKHRWRLPHKLIKAINLFRLQKGQPSHNPKFASPHSATCASGTPSRVKCVNFQGEFPQNQVGEELKHNEVSSPERPAQAPSPVSEKVQKECRELSFAGNHGSTGISLSGPTKDRQPTDSFPSSLRSSHFQSGSVGSTERESSELSPSSRNGSRLESSNWASRDPCHREQTVAMKLETLRAEETIGTVEAKDKESQLQTKATLESCLQKTTDITNVPKRVNEYSQTSPDLLFPKSLIFQHPEGPCLPTGATSVLKHPKQALQRAQDLPSSAPHYHITRNPTGDPLARPFLGVLKRDQRNILGHRNPSNFTCQCKHPGPLNEKRFEEPKTSQVRQRIPKFPIKEATGKSLESKCLQKEVQPQNSFLKIKLFFEGLFKNQKGKHQDPLQKCQPALGSANWQGSCQSRRMMDNQIPEAKALMSAVGQILEEKVAHMNNLNEHKQPIIYKAYRASHSHRAPFNPGSPKPNTGDQKHIKKVHFINGKESINSKPPLLKKTVPTAHPCALEPSVPGAHRHLQHCPRHCFLRGGLLSGTR